MYSWLSLQNTFFQKFPRISVFGISEDKYKIDMALSKRILLSLQGSYSYGGVSFVWDPKTNPTQPHPKNPGYGFS